LQKLVTDTPQGRILEKLIKHDIAVYAAHTNLDVTSGGVNDLLAEALGLENVELLVPTSEMKLKKLVVFVPKTHSEQVREAIGNAGAGAIGNYSHCSFSSEGTGYFLPGENTNPFIGRAGEIEAVKEERLETIFPEVLEKKVLSALIKAHPYEEVAYDIYPLSNKGEALGLGKIGTVPEMSLKDFSNHVKKVFGLSGVRVVGDLQASIKKVAVLGGDGNKYWNQAKFKGADVYVTGDMYYHVAHDASAAGLNIVDPGHHIESVMKQGVTNVLVEKCAKKGYDVNIFPSELNTDPFQFL
jgi:dinuclear metal center YbgI/SA1388 family protein